MAESLRRGANGPQAAPALALALGTFIPPEHIVPLAALAEDRGFEEVWVTEDFWFTGGLSAMSAVLASTERVRVGVGITSAVVRHPAILAMEISTMARMHPGRVILGVGLGLPDSLRQMDLYPRSQLTAVRDCVNSTRSLLKGEPCTLRSATFGMRDVKLVHPPERPVPIHIGASGPKMLRLSGEIADGTVLSIFSPIPYLRWARERIAEGLTPTAAEGAHRITALALFNLNDDPAAARAALRPLIALDLAAQVASPSPQLIQYGIADELGALATGPPDQLEREFPDQWIDDMAVVGEPRTCMRRIEAFAAAGVDTVALHPFPSENADEMVLALAEQLIAGPS